PSPRERPHPGRSARRWPGGRAEVRGNCRRGAANRRGQSTRPADPVDQRGRHGLPALHLHGDARPEGRTGETRMGVAILGNVKFTVGWLYPDLMNIYGDRGNILTLLRRAEWHGCAASVVELGRGAAHQMDEADVL